MKAITYTDYGPPDVLRLVEIGVPVPKDDEVLLRVHAASVNPLDWHFLRGTPYFLRLMAGWRRPKVNGLGVDVAGRVDAVGRKVTRFRPGDEVFGICRGAFAEYVCTPEKRLVKKPANVTFAQAAAVPAAAISALQGLRDQGQVQPGQSVLVNGAAGGVGTFAVQLAKWLGAHVTAVCSTRNVELVRSIGADHVVDYTWDNFVRGGRQYDVIIDMIGNHSLRDLRRVLTSRGTLVLVGGPNKGRWLGPLTGMIKAGVCSWFARQRLRPLMAKLRGADLQVLKELLRDGKITPVIDRSFDLGEVAEAIRYLETSHARGKVVITVDGGKQGSAAC